jgi:hypothetical protein
MTEEAAGLWTTAIAIASVVAATILMAGDLSKPDAASEFGVRNLEFEIRKEFGTLRIRCGSGIFE